MFSKRGSLMSSNGVTSGRQDDECFREMAVLESLGIMVAEWDADGRQSYISRMVPEILAGNYDGRPLFDVWLGDDVVAAADKFAFVGWKDAALSGDMPELTIRLRHRNGKEVWYRLKHSILCAQKTRVMSITNVDDDMRAMQALGSRAEYDSLTGACNMQTFFVKASEKLESQPEQDWYVLRYDLAGLKNINEIFGFSEGDNLLRTIATLSLRLLDKKQEILARLSGDVFSALLCGPRERVLRFVEELNFTLGNQTPHKVRLIFGICHVEKPGTPVYLLCDWAHLAQKSIHDGAQENHAFFEGALRERLFDENSIEDQMYSALEERQFTLFLQPKVEISTGRIYGAEGLVRWLHPDEGLISPWRFIPLFERNGFIIDLDEYIWEEACRLLRSWLDKGYQPDPISINVSRLHFHDTDFADNLIMLADKYDLPRHLLELELTESAFFDSENTLIKIMNKLQKEGFHFSMDDFGTGYSSLSTLRTLPFNIVKLDRAFISDGTDNVRGQVVARHTVAMARDLNMKIIAEGVETVEQARFLLTIGCNHVQGYYYSPPITSVEYEILRFVQEKAFWVDPELRKEAISLGLPVGQSAPFREL